jgi:hypothetical protein
MNRRELIRKLLGTAAAGGTVMTAKVIEAPPDLPPPFLLVLEGQEEINQETAERIARQMREALADTPFGLVKTIVLGNGMTLKAIGADGRLLTQPVTVPIKRRRRTTVRRATKEERT